MKIYELLDLIDSWAPFATQESWDNSGLITGDANDDINKALLCLDCTLQVVEEAVANFCNVIICHHPPVFTPLKVFTAANPLSGVVVKAIRHNVAILALHTNLDNAAGGVSHEIGLRLGLKEMEVLQPLNGSMLKIQTFCPAAQAGFVRNALFKAGAGELGRYTSCSFNSRGTGTFTPGESSEPFAGERGKFHEEQEIKIECILPSWTMGRVVKALLRSHPYEVPAYDLIPLVNEWTANGAGISGLLELPMDSGDFLDFLASRMKARVVRHTGYSSSINRVACCGGSGSFLLEPAVAARCDVMVTADVKYHQFVDYANRLMVADIGHYESEQFTPELIHKKLTENLITFALLLSKVNTNPINYSYYGNNG